MERNNDLEKLAKSLDGLTLNLLIKGLKKHLLPMSDPRVSPGDPKSPHMTRPGQKPHGHRVGKGGSQQRLMIMLRRAAEVLGLDIPSWNEMDQMSGEQVWDIAGKHFGGDDGVQNALDSLGGAGEAGKNLNMGDVSDEFIRNAVKGAPAGSEKPQQAPKKPGDKKPPKKPFGPFRSDPVNFQQLEFDHDLDSIRETLDRLTALDSGKPKKLGGLLGKLKSSWDKYFAAKKSKDGAAKEQAWKDVEAESKAAGIPDRLPQDPSLYFDTTGLDNVETIPTDKLKLVRPPESQPERVNRAKHLMFGASKGVLDKRGPITVYKNKDGTYTVQDGNSTSGAALASGWDSIPAQVVPAPEGVDEQDAPRPASISGDVMDVAQNIKSRVMAFLDRMVHPDESKPPPPQKYNSLQEMYDAHVSEAEDFTGLIAAASPGGLLSKKDAINRARGGESVAGVGFLGPIKKQERAEEKVNDDYDGDFNQLKDLVRATVLVDSADQIPEQMARVREAIKGTGWSIAGVKNRWSSEKGAEGNPANKGDVGGYRDVLMSLVSPNGAVMELQLNTAAMFDAKDSEGHDLYKEHRSLKGRIARLRERIGRGTVSGGLMSQLVSLDKEADRLASQMKTLYNNAFIGSFPT